MVIIGIVIGCALIWIPWRVDHEERSKADGYSPAGGYFPPGYNGHGVAHTLSAGDIGGSDWY